MPAFFLLLGEYLIYFGAVKQTNGSHWGSITLPKIPKTDS